MPVSPSDLDNPFVTDSYPQSSQRMTVEKNDGITPTTIPLALILGALAGAVTFFIAKHCTTNPHILIGVPVGVGGTTMGITVAYAALNTREDLDAKKLDALQD